MELEETHKLWKQATHVMRYFKETQEPRKTEFMERFFDGYDQKLTILHVCCKEESTWFKFNNFSFFKTQDEFICYILCLLCGKAWLIY